MEFFFSIKENTNAVYIACSQVIHHSEKIEQASTRPTERKSQGRLGGRDGLCGQSAATTIHAPSCIIHAGLDTYMPPCRALVIHLDYICMPCEYTERTDIKWLVIPMKRLS